MRQTNPMVIGGRLYQSENKSDPIDVGSPTWYDWLEHHAAFTFVDHAATFMAHKGMLETKGHFWEAYCTRQDKLYRIHLGYSHALTMERLQAAARAFAGEHVLDESAGKSSTQPATSRHTSPHITLNVDYPMALIQTKFYRPHNRSDLITRTRLLVRLNDALGGNVTLVCAPAGCGKTTLLAEWVQTIDRPTAWLSLDADDNDLRPFVRSLAAALQTACSGAFQSLSSLFTAPRYPPPVQVVKLFIDDLADVPDNVVLVLDEYDFISNREVHTLLELLIEHLPPQLHLVLSCRSDPPLPLDRWHAKGFLNELRRADLLFLLDETEAFLMRVLGNDLAHETAVALEELTEGWIALLRLAALSLRSIPDRGAFVERLRHFPDRTMNSYLVEELLDHLAPAVQEFLEQTSILEQFCAELCVAVMGDAATLEQVQAILDDVERANIFLVSLDDHQGWYRFHHLFRRLLEQRLQSRFNTEGLATLHLQASAWYAAQGLIKEAIEHALAAGDTSEAAKLVEARIHPAFEQEQWVQLERWLRLLPEEQIQDSPSLLFALLWTLLIRGKLTKLPRVLRAAEQLLGTADSCANGADNAEQRLLRVLIADAWGVLQYFNGQLQASLESVRSALALLPPGEEIVASLILQDLAFALQANGEEEGALTALQQALLNQSANPASTARMLIAQAYVYLAAGKLHQVEHTARHLLQIAQKAELALSQYWAHWFLGVVYYEWNNLDAAVYHCSVVIAHQHQAHFWAVQEAMCVLALAYQAKGLSTQAQESAHSLLEWVQEQNNPGELMTVYAFCCRLSLVQDEVEGASQWLEMAGEQEVLGPMLFFEDPPVTRAWLLLAKGDHVSVAEGQAILTHLLKHVEVIHNTRKMIQVLALQAWAYDLQGRESEALEVLERALALARPGGFIRTFADLPPLLKLLHQPRKHLKARRQVDRKLNAYQQHILAAMSPVAALPVSTEALLLQEDLEPLTNRELQILRLLDQNLTNKEIARELVLTTGTVKVHISNVYRKLSVNNRRAAVTLAKALGILAAY